MESNVKILDPEVLMPRLLELMKEAETVPLVISGSSMTPFLVHGRDTVYLSKAEHPPKRGDMILYRRTCGAYILHRIYGTKDGTYTLVGDAQTVLECGIRPEQVLAVVTAVRRKGKLLKKGNCCWDFFEKVWIRMVPLRPVVRAAYGILKRILK